MVGLGSDTVPTRPRVGEEETPAPSETLKIPGKAHFARTQAAPEGEERSFILKRVMKVLQTK